MHMTSDFAIFLRALVFFLYERVRAFAGLAFFAGGACVGLCGGRAGAAGAPED